MSQTTLIIQRQNVLNIVWADNLAISPTVTRFEGISWAAVREAIIGFLGASVFYIVWKGVCGLLWFILIRIPNQYPKIVTVWAIDDVAKVQKCLEKKALVQRWCTGVGSAVSRCQAANHSGKSWKHSCALRLSAIVCGRQYFGIFMSNWYLSI